MRGTPPYVSSIAEAYQISRQSYYVKSSSLGLTKSEWLNPELVFFQMLQHGNTSPLRVRLTDPTTRENIKNKISKIS